MGIHFDHDGNGFAETTGWANKDDGLLVWDRNGNGRIDDGKELFGNNTLLASGQNAANGFLALSELDTNLDGKIDTSDSAFNQLRVWKDADSDAIVDAGELLGLAEVNVGSLSTSFTSQNQVDPQGNKVLQVGSYTDTDGIVRSMNDIWFGVDTARTIDLNQVALSDEIAALPNVEGFGNVGSLQQAMERDGSGELKTLVSLFKGELNSAARDSLLDQIIFAWTGASAFTAASRGSYISDGRKLYALESFVGKAFIQGSGTNAGLSNPGPNAAEVLVNAYAKLADFIKKTLISEIHVKPYFKYVKFELVNNVSSPIYSDVATAFEQTFATSHVRGMVDLMYFMESPIVNGGATFTSLLDSFINGMSVSEIAAVESTNTGLKLGTTGNDILSTIDDTNHVLRGFSGSDTLTSGAGNDRLEGGTGNDVLNGGRGSDLYLFNLGDGQDVINDDNASYIYGGVDVLRFGAGILASDIAVSRVGTGLLLSHSNGQDRVTVSNWFTENTGRYQLERIEFADGTVWSSAALSAQLLTLTGGAGDDVLTGVSADFTHVLSGGGGNDTLTAGAGNDRLEGGTGNDVLNGGRGSDLYLFNLGDGQDVINDDNASYIYGGVDVLRFGAGILASDIAVSRVGTGLLLSHSNGQDRVTVSNWFTENTGRYQLERIEFADGTVWSSSQAASRASTDGNDVIVGTSGHDRLQGGKGNDLLQGGDGSDIYIFAAGDGLDTINNLSSTPSDVDLLRIDGITTQDLWLSREGNNLVIDATGSTDRITIQDWYTSAAQQVDVIQAGSSALYASAVNNLVNAMAEFGAPAGGEISLTQEQRDQVNAVIATNWQ
ncbi:hypothetical protein THL1_3370 [Pseudomonas sp. TCU-HL1]|nr:hypothetical protein THL1_3370 [Pseudomonas sp. TCU-HL1]